MLYWLYRFGGLSTPQLIELVFQPISPSWAAAQSKASRHLTCMESESLLRTQAVTRSHLRYHALTAHGLKHLLEHYSMQRSRSNIRIKDVAVQRTHRDASNWAVIRMQAEGMQVWTEREIRAHRREVPVHILEMKIPDALAKLPRRKEFGCIWVEVENSMRATSQLANRVKWLTRTAFPGRHDHPTSLRGDYTLARVHFVLSAAQTLSFPAKLREALLNKLHSDVDTWAESRIEFCLAPPLTSHQDRRIVVGIPQ